jgi:hypothetical protein
MTNFSAIGTAKMAMQAYGMTHFQPDTSRWTVPLKFLMKRNFGIKN